MLQAMFSGVSGLQAHQTRMNTIGNNIANVNTVGFKSGRVSFQDQLSQTLRAAGSPSATSGGQNPAQVGLGVSLGAVDTILTQGNLQGTGKSTDIAVQGNGYFVVSGGQGTAYTRDGSFDLDSSGALVNPATGVKLLGYQADRFGNIDTTTPVTSTSALQIPIGTLTDAKQTDNVGVVGNLDAGAALLSTKVDYIGNLDLAAPAGSIVTNSATVYDNLGNAHSVLTTFTNPVSGSPLTGTGVPTGATRSWDINVKVDNNTIYDSAAGKSKMYFAGGGWKFANTATGAVLGSQVKLDGGSASNEAPQVPGTSGANPLTMDLNYGSITNAGAASLVTNQADGQSGSSPGWGTSIQVYDSLGVGHLITIKYTHAHVGSNPPQGGTGRWDWSATENGQLIGSSTTTGNTPIYFGSNGRVVAGASQTITVSPTDGSVSPFDIKLNNSDMTQLAADANAAASIQDGYPVGTLQNFAIGPDGVITGVFSSGQSRALGQVALASFANPSGLEKSGGNLLRESTNSGAAQIGLANQSGRGKLSPGYLEMSNVDLSTEFTNLIVTQRGFQANTRMITTVDNLLEDVINLKR